MKCIRPLLTATLAALTVAAPLAAAADTYPSRPVSVIVPFPAGGGADLIARSVTARMAQLLGQPMAIENQSGASGDIGITRVQRAAPDGYTLLMTNNTLVTRPAISKVPFDPLKDFTPIGIVGYGPVAIAVHPSVPANNVNELLALLARDPNKYSYSSCGIGTVMHLAGEMFKVEAKVQMTHIAYRGCGPAIVDGAGGQVPILFNTYSAMKPMADQGKLRILALASRNRLAQAPDLPTLGEANSALKEVIADNWNGMLAPAKLPAPIAAQLQKELMAAVATPSVRAQLQQAGVEIRTADPAEMTNLMRQELARWNKLASQVKISAE